MLQRKENTKDNTVLQREVAHTCYIDPNDSPKFRLGYFFVVNTKTLQQLGANQISFYLKLKVIHRNGCFYNYSINQISKHAGCSHATAKKNIQALIKSGLAAERNNHLCLVKLKRGKSNKKVLISKHMNLSEIKDRLLLLLIERKNNQMNFSNKKKDSLKRDIADKKLSKNEISNVIGIRTLSQYLKVSPGYLSNFTKRMVNNGKLKIKRVKIDLGNIPVFNEYCNGYLYKNKKGNTILYSGSIYSL